MKQPLFFWVLLLHPFFLYPCLLASQLSQIENPGSSYNTHFDDVYLINEWGRDRKNPFNTNIP